MPNKELTATTVSETGAMHFYRFSFPTKLQQHQYYSSLTVPQLALVPIMLSVTSYADLSSHNVLQLSSNYIIIVLLLFVFN